MAFSVGVMSAMYLTKGITGNRWTQTSSCDLSTHCLHRHTYSKMHNVRIHFAASHSELWLFHYCITEYSRFITLMSGALCKEALSSLSRSSLTDIQLTIITLSWHTIWRQIIWDFITFQSLSLCHCNSLLLTSFLSSSSSTSCFSLQGAHLNPAVSLSFCVLGQVRWGRLVPYCLSQLLGAYMASALVYLVYYG